MSNLAPLERWKGFVDGTVTPVPMISEIFPMKFITVEKGYIKVTVCAEEKHLLPHKWAHGGFCATVIDTVLAAAVETSLEKGQFASTTDLNIKMSKAIPAGLELTAEAKLVTKSRSLGTAETKLVEDEGNIYAWGSASLMIRQAR